MFVSTRLNMWAKMVACIVKPTERKTELFFIMTEVWLSKFPKELKTSLKPSYSTVNAQDFKKSTIKQINLVE